MSLTPLSWSVDGDLSLPDWVQHGRRLGVMGRGAGWWIGDWLRFGNMRYGERYSRASKITGYDTQTLMNMVYVASRIELSRRRENLTWSHHAEVAPLPPVEQERWLDAVERDRLSVRDLRELIRLERRQAEGVQAELPPVDSGHVRCPECGLVFEPEQAQPTAAAG